MINKIIIALCLLVGTSVSAKGQHSIKESTSQENPFESKRPSLIPLPQSIEWSSEEFNLKKCKAILINSSALKDEAQLLQKVLSESVKSINIKQSDSPAKNTIELKLGKLNLNAQPEEAYSLQVKPEKITLVANTRTGIFYGLQTLFQLINGGTMVAGCSIQDYPAMKWRGYMVDVGRNYQSIALLKQQIDMMSKYKLNVFHFHPTEDIAWRIQIKKYPELTAAKHMQRNQGSFYTIDEIKDLIEYCKKRSILFVPEIDMPGHSHAFTRAMGVDMQSEKGLAIVLDILEEVCQTYDVPYIHIGADEVNIKNEQFLPQVIATIRKHNKQVIGWDPGRLSDNQAIRQLWVEENQVPDGKFIDSKYLYISEIDPLNSVVTIFNRQFGGRLNRDTNFLGAEICVWSDRKVAKEYDLINMNPVYPSILAFSERSWSGGGNPGVIFRIGADSSAEAAAFTEFEKRLLEHKQKYFSQLPFNYVKQTHIKWNLYGPFKNQGNLKAMYWPEKQGISLEDSTKSITATGGTVWLWHTFSPYVKAWLPSFEENTTWYAYTKFWSNSDSISNVWIGFKDLSKSGADATPPLGEWDYVNSRIWVNDSIIAPPKWAHAGRASHKLEEPLVDEGFYYSPPSTVKVKRGWNKVLIKLPMGTFNPSSDWQTPPKFMFTFIPVRPGNGVNWEADEVVFQPGKK